jgi:hypothetical protein
LLVDWLQPHHHGALRDLVFEGRYAEPALALSVRLQDDVPANRRRVITARFEPVNQPEKMAL